MIDLDKEQQQPQDMNPFVTMWRQPRETIKYLLLNKGFWIIALLGFVGAWASALYESTGKADEKDIEGNLVNPDFVQPNFLMELITTAFSAIITVLIGGAIVAFFYLIIGKIFKGTGVFKDMYKGAMLTTMPMGIVLPFVLIWLVLVPSDFYGIGNGMGLIGSILSVIAGVLMVVATIYTIVLTIVMISEVHQFSKWKAFFTMLIPAAVVIAIVLVIVIGLLAILI